MWKRKQHAILLDNAFFDSTTHPSYRTSTRTVKTTRLLLAINRIMKTHVGVLVLVSSFLYMYSRARPFSSSLSFLCIFFHAFSTSVLLCHPTDLDIVGCCDCDRNFVRAILIFVFLSWSRFSGGHNFFSHGVIRHSSVKSIFVVINIITTSSLYFFITFSSFLLFSVHVFFCFD